MALADIITVVEQQLAADGVGVTVTSRLGAEYLERMDVYPPSIVWVPTEDEFAITQPRHKLATRQQRQRYLRRAGCKLFLWAQGSGDLTADPYLHLKAIETFLNRVLVAIHQVTHASVKVKGGHLIDGANVQLGRGYQLELSFDAPVVPAVDEATAVTITSVSAADSLRSTMDFPDSDVTGTPAP